MRGEGRERRKSEWSNLVAVTGSSYGEQHVSPPLWFRSMDKGNNGHETTHGVAGRGCTER